MALGSAGDKLLITFDAYLHIVGDTEVYLAIRGVCFFLLRLEVATFVGLDNISLTERLNTLMREYAICCMLLAYELQWISILYKIYLVISVGSTIILYIGN